MAESVRTTRSVILDQLGAERPYAVSEPVRVRSVTLGAPRAGELRVRVDAAGVCHSDLSVVNGSRPRPVPMALGHEATGIVEEIGDGVSDVAIGDRVVLVFVPSCGSCPPCVRGEPALCAAGAVANGAGGLLGGGSRISMDGKPVHHHLGVSAFSEQVVVDRSSAVVVPSDIPADIAAMFGCALLTGVGAVLNTAQVRPGESVVVFGLGGVGLAVLMGAVLSGASPVYAVDPVPAKRDLALELGATGCFAPDEAVAGLAAVLAEGVDVAFEAVGSEQVMASAFDVTRRGGRTVAVGLPHPERSLVLPAVRVVAEAKSLIGSYMGSAQPQRDIPRLISLWRSGRLPVERLRGGSYRLDEVAQAFDDLESGETLRQVIIP